MVAIYKREMASYFHSPVGWTVVAVITGLMSIIFYYQAGSGSANMESLLDSYQTFLGLCIPILTMRLFSEERRNGTEILLYTSPVSLFRIVIGKYLAAMTVFLISISSILLQFLLVAIWGGRVGATTFGAFLALVFVCSIFVAIGTFASAVTENQIVAALISEAGVVAILLLQQLASLARNTVISTLNGANQFGMSAAAINDIAQAIYNGILWIDPFSRMSNMNQGIFDIIPLVYSLSLSIFFLFLTYRVVEKKRWSQG